MILVDSDIVIDFLQGVEPSRTRLAGLLESNRAATTVLNSFEILSGARTAKRLAQVEALLAAMKVLEITPLAASRAAAVRRALDRAGLSIATPDALIAGVALTARLPLWTRNRRHFEHVSELELA